MQERSKHSERLDSKLLLDLSPLNLGGSLESVLYKFNEIHPETASHCLRVGRLAQYTSYNLGLNEHDQHIAFLAGTLHDIGKAMEVLLVNEELNVNDKSYAESNPHQIIGGDILQNMNFPSKAIEIVRNHHEPLYTSQHPDLLTQIVVLSDRFDAIHSPRFYSPGTSKDQALHKLKGLFGVNFSEEIEEPFTQAVRNEH